MAFSITISTQTLHENTAYTRSTVKDAPWLPKLSSGRGTVRKTVICLRGKTPALHSKRERKSGKRHKTSITLFTNKQTARFG